MRVPTADGEVTTGHNQCPGDVINETALANTLRVCQAEYNRAATDRREATAVMRDEKRAFQKVNAEVYAEINAIMESARERMKDKLRACPAYEQAEQDKKDAALRMKAVVKRLKGAGIDVAAFKQVLRMSELDRYEREEFFDAIDIYAKALRLWSGDEI